MFLLYLQQQLSLFQINTGHVGRGVPRDTQRGDRDAGRALRPRQGELPLEVRPQERTGQNPKNNHFKLQTIKQLLRLLGRNSAKIIVFSCSTITANFLYKRREFYAHAELFLFKKENHVSNLF